MLSNPYLRAFLVSLAFFIGVTVRSYQKYGDWTDHRRLIFTLTLGVTMLVAAGLTGTFSRRSAKPWSWLKTAIVTFACWMGIFGIMAILLSLQSRLNP